MTNVSKVDAVQQDGKYIYKTNSGVTITTTSEASVFENENGQVYAQGLENAVVKGTDRKDNVVFKDCSISEMDLGDEIDFVNVLGKTDLPTDKTENVEHIYAQEGAEVSQANGETITGVEKMDEDKAYEFNQLLDVQQEIEETENNGEEIKSYAPDAESTTVVTWVRGQKDDNCLWNIVKNHYEGIPDNQIMNACIQLAAANNMENVNSYIFDGDKITLPTFTYDDNGNITGYVKAGEEAEEATTAEEDKPADGTEAAGNTGETTTTQEKIEKFYKTFNNILDKNADELTEEEKEFLENIKTDLKSEDGKDQTMLLMYNALYQTNKTELTQQDIQDLVYSLTINKVNNQALKGIIDLLPEYIQGEGTKPAGNEPAEDEPVGGNESQQNGVPSKFDNLENYKAEIEEKTEDGQPITVKYLDENGQIQRKAEYVYNNNGKPTTVTLSDKEGNPIQKNTYEYDSEGNVTSSIQYEYDENGKLAKAIKLDSNGDVIETSFYENGKETKRVKSDGTELISKQEMKDDIDTIKESTQHNGTDEDALAELVSRYAYAGQLEELCDLYRTDTGNNLLDALKGEVSGENADNMFDKLFSTDISKPYDVDTPEGLDNAVEALYDAMKGCGTSNIDLINILGNSNYSKREIKMIVERYNEKYDKDLKTKIKNETSGFFEDLLVERIDQAMA